MATKKPSANPFDAIAKPATPKKAASNKIASDINDDIKTAVDTVIIKKGMIKDLEKDLDEASDKIRDHVFPQQARHAREGNYSKTFTVEGSKGSLSCVSSDKWTLPKEAELHEALKKFLGPKFDEWFQVVRNITLNEAVSANTDIVADIMKVLEKHGVGAAEAFTVVDTLKTKKNLDENQFELDDTKLTQFRTICKQYKSSLK